VLATPPSASSWVYNNVIARWAQLAALGRSLDGPRRRTASNLPHVVLPSIATALLAGGMLAFALSFDEVIVTLHAGQQQTLPIWMLGELAAAAPAAGDNVVAVFVILLTFGPILMPTT